MNQTREITLLLRELSDGKNVVDRIIPLVYKELKHIAQRHLNRERADHTLNTTALVHEAYLKLIDQNEVNWQNRAHFFAIAAQSMRRILINYAKSRMAQKRGGDRIAVTFDEQSIPEQNQAEELIALDEALGRLGDLDVRQARIVELRFFGGLTVDEISEMLKVSPITVHRDWRLARAWLKREIGNS
jgi:RNA polymerase sigma factor (TIGR02999 family)